MKKILTWRRESVSPYSCNVIADSCRVQGFPNQAGLPSTTTKTFKIHLWAKRFFRSRLESRPGRGCVYVCVCKNKTLKIQGAHCMYGCRERKHINCWLCCPGISWNQSHCGRCTWWQLSGNLQCWRHKWQNMANVSRHGRMVPSINPRAPVGIQ